MKYMPLMPMWTGTEVVFANFSEGKIYRAFVNEVGLVAWQHDDALVNPIFQDIKDTQDALEPEIPEEVFYDAIDTQKRIRSTNPPTFTGQPTCRNE